MRFIGHSTVRLELGGAVVLTDPVLTPRVGPLTRVAQPPSEQDWSGVDIVLISHLHADHLHLPSLRLVGSDTRIVVPRGAGPWLRRKGFPLVEEIDVGERITEGNLCITATPAHHSGHRWGPRLTHGPQSPALGHLLESGGIRVYVAGDTGLFPEMASLAPVDVALLPVWGWGWSLGEGHLDPACASEAVGLLRPSVAVPVHWGTLAFTGLARMPGPPGSRMRRLLVDPPQEFAAEVAAAGRDTSVRIAAPGTSVPLDDAVRRPR
ncbi:MBL fold metallo-hydrolase [Haloechinothrix sp. LS1_15]|uniref:MBL fold metallo-hydrolase n=1 Tax=Haloechinothrix sp. LS1_15 TaxID=2652248 RepID=UPI00294B758A|nr:MBL fold metallo-hydrolase [Haloechinothrix sp. LS1_15]